MSVGYEHIDLQACQERGVSVTNTPNVSTDSVAELTVSLVLLTARRLLEGVPLIGFILYLPWFNSELCIDSALRYRKMVRLILKYSLLNYTL